MRPLLILVGLVAACSDDGVAEPGVLQLGNYGPMISMSSTATAGTPFGITVTTYGVHCRVMGSTDVTISGDEALVEPFDRYIDPGDNGACIQIVQFFLHQTTINFASPGPKTVRFHGRHVSSYAPTVDEPFDVSMPISIQ